MGKPNKFNDEMKERLIELRKSGLGNRRLAKELGVSRSTITLWLRKIGMDGRLEEYKPSKSETEIVKTIICKYCGDEYETKRHHTKFCSERCRVRHNKLNRGNTYTCRYCGDKYKGYKERLNCTDECRNTEENKRELVQRLVEAINPYRRKRCRSCNKTFYAGHLKRLYCSDSCSRKNRYVPKTYNHKCRECGKHYTDNQKNSGGCSDECKKRYTNRVSRLNRYNRIKENGKIHWSISLWKLIRRDKGICHICNNKVDMNVDYNDDYYPSIDHVIPIAKGGTHTWDNVKLAHRLCNSYKSDEIIKESKQLTLL